MCIWPRWFQQWHMHQCGIFNRKSACKWLTTLSLSLFLSLSFSLSLSLCLFVSVSLHRWLMYTTTIHKSMDAGTFFLNSLINHKSMYLHSKYLLIIKKSMDAGSSCMVSIFFVFIFLFHYLKMWNVVAGSHAAFPPHFSFASSCRNAKRRERECVVYWYSIQ